MNKNEVVNIFWTGGFDSTLRVLKLIVVLKKKVRPHYILDPNRKSRFNEFKAIETIRSAIFKRFPYSRDLLYDLVIKDLRDIGKDSEFHENYLDLAKKYKIGRQYAWLASYCEENKIKGMELCLHKPGAHYSYLIDKVKLIEKDNDSFYILKYKKSYGGLSPLFQYLRLPFLEYAKLDIQEEAMKFEFSDILELTWFCHAPKLNNKPCGTCTPCIIIMEQGIRLRISFIGRLRYYLIVKTGLKKLRERLAL